LESLEAISLLAVIMRVLVTRPEDDARETASRLIALGHEPIIAPMISIRFLDGAPLDLSGVQAFAATSANGVRSLTRRTQGRALPIFSVGRQTAETARASGFTHVVNADGDATALARCIANALKPEQGAVLHATGAEGSGAFAMDLRASGFKVQTEILYETPGVSSLPPAAAAALRARKRLDAALFYSGRTAKEFCDCVRAAGLEKKCEGVVAIAISKAASEPLAGIKFKEIRIAAAPNQDELLACLG
jgi:uroporphyrinogen-III synthase